MTTLPKITEKTIRSHVGERSLTLGERYFRDGSVFNARRQGRTLKARCQGSRDQAYQVEVTLGDKGIAEAACSCPVGSGGHCKHVGAVLLAWRHQPEEFTEIEELDTALGRRSKEELIALIKHLLRREPDLELLLDMPLPGAAPAGTAVSPDAYRRQAEAAFAGQDGFEWGAASAIADDLQAVKEVGDEFLRRQDHAGAAAVYQGILAAVLDNYQMVQDEEGDLHVVVGDCAEGLGKCLDAETDPARREPILRALFEVTRFDIDQGGIGLSDRAPNLDEHTTPEERRTLAGWVRAALAEASRGWSRESLAGWLLNLEADTLDDEAFLRICKETGRVHDLVNRLLQLGRLDEAVRETEQTSDWELLNLAGLFVSHRHSDVAERLVRERSAKSQDTRLLEWLKKRALDHKDPAAALELAEKVFHVRPSLADYKEIRKLAKKVGRWDVLRPRLLKFLQDKQHAYVLIPVYLDEGEIDRALEAVKPERPSAYGYGYGYGMALDVAKAAEKTRPEAAREIYRRQAEGLINQRGRGAYQEACKFLKKVRDLDQRLGEGAAWARYIGQVRERHRSLRALQEELTKARL
jgi:uncharacterized Zn finger protein